MIGKIFDKDASVLFLIFLMLLTPFTSVSLVGNAIQQPKVFTQSFAKSIEVEGKKFNLKGFGKVTEYANGTKLIEGSVTIENISEHIPKLRVNLTKVITAEELSFWRGETKRNERPPIYKENDHSTLTTYTFNKERWDDLLFVVSSPQIWIKYKHDDN
ncbi:MAG: hypothetical protein ACPLYF_04685, partial [Fervidobacterium sp.]